MNVDFVNPFLESILHVLSTMANTQATPGTLTVKANDTALGDVTGIMGMTGHQAKGTLGRHILERPEEARILGQVYPVRARIEKINGFSAHADRDELLEWVSGFKKYPKKIFVVHGEEEASMTFASASPDAPMMVS